MSEKPMAGKLRDNGLTLAFLLLFLVALVGQAVSGFRLYNSQQVIDGAQKVDFLDYVTSPSFGVDVLENWQSEFLAVASMTFLPIFLRQRGSPESKPVGLSHGTTGIEG